MHKLVEVVLLAMLVVLSFAALMLEPWTCLALLGKTVLAVAGLVLLVWLWRWRRPRLRLGIERLVRTVRNAAAVRVRVLSAEWSGNILPFDHLFVRVVVPSDAEREVLESDVFRTQFARLVADAQLPFVRPTQVSLDVASQETVDRDFGGNWYYYDR